MFLQDEHNMDMVAFLVNITAHLNELNLKLQGPNSLISDLMAAVRSFQKKLEIFKVDLQEECTHFPRVKEQIHDDRDKFLYTDFIEKLMRNFSQRFDSFTLGKHHLLLIQNPYLIRDVREFSKVSFFTF